MGLGCFVDVDGLVGRGRFQTCPYMVLRRGRGCVARGLGTGLGKGVVYGFWVPACAGMTGDCVDGQGERNCGEEGAGHPLRTSLRWFASPHAARRGRGCMARGLVTGLGKGVVHGFWVPACAGMTWVWGGNDGWLPPFVLRTFPPPSGGNPAALRPRFTLTLALCHRGRGVNRWRLVGVGVDYAVESGGAFVDPFGGVGEEEFDAEV